MLLLSLFLACSPGSDPASARPGADDSAGDDSDGGEAGPSAEDMILWSSDGADADVDITWFDDEYIEEDCPTDCSVNTDPTLGEPIYVVNGEVVHDPAPHDRDEVNVFFPFADAECNLACGWTHRSFSSPRASSNGGGSIPSNLPCDTDSSDVYLGMSLNEVQVGEYELSFRVEDACGGESDSSTGGFVVD